MAIECLKLFKIHFLVLEKVVVGNLLPWLPSVELALENPYLVIQGHELVVERSTGVIRLLGGFAVGTFLTSSGLGPGSLGSNISGSSLSIEVARHEVLVGVQILIEVDNVVYGHFVRVPGDGAIHKLFHLLSLSSTSVGNIQLAMHVDNMSRVTDK